MGSLVVVFCAWLLMMVTLHFIPVHAEDTELSIKPDYQRLVIGASSAAGAVSNELTSKQGEKDGTWKVEILHRDALPTSKPRLGVAETLVERMKRDAARVKAVNQRVQMAVMGANPAHLKLSATQPESQISVEEISSQIVSGVSQGSGEYFTRFGIGTPAKQAYFVLDTGSDLSWTQCAPCKRCYKQSDPLFNPSASASFRSVTCLSPLCSQLQINACRRNQCLYQVSYGDGSFTVGNFAQETFSFAGGSTVKNVGIGCGHDNEGLFVGAAGLLGLGAGKLSFPSQISSDFSYCLADRLTGGSSALVFGKGAEPLGAKFTPLLKNSKLGTFYYVELVGLSVGGRQLPLSPSVFKLQMSGSGGVIVDSGTAVTRLAGSAYSVLRESFRAGTTDLPSAGAFSLFDTCYNFSGVQAVDVPTVDLHFAGGTSVRLPASNYLVPIDSVGTYCLAFAPSSTQLSILGNMQQQGFRVSFSSRSARIGFAANQC